MVVESGKKRLDFLLCGRVGLSCTVSCACVFFVLFLFCFLHCVFVCFTICCLFLCLATAVAVCLLLHIDINHVCCLFLLYFGIFTGRPISWPATDAAWLLL